MMLDPVAIARQFLFVREAAEQNTGQRVEAIQKWSGGQKGESWCCYFATMVLDIAFQGNAPIPRLGACEDVHQLAIKNDWLVTEPIEGDLFLRLTPEGHAHHVGLVTENGNGIAGNTSEDGSSSNGDSVVEHPIGGGSVVYVQYPRG
jgi:hypothetical protein